MIFFSNFFHRNLIIMLHFCHHYYVRNMLIYITELNHVILISKCDVCAYIVVLNGVIFKSTP